MGKRKGIPPEYTPSVASVVDIWSKATDRDRDLGACWYPEAHRVAKDLCGDAATGAGVIAALSPQAGWTSNLEMARDLASGRRPRMTTGANILKAERIMAGEPWRDVLGGPKVRSFAQCIEDPWDGHSAVIDRHAFDVAVGRVTDDAIRSLVLSRAGVYDTFAGIYRAAARDIGEDPCVVQATTWTTWRRLKSLPE